MLEVSPPTRTTPFPSSHVRLSDVSGPLPLGQSAAASHPRGDSEVVVWTMERFHHDDAQMQRCAKAQIFEAETSQEARSTGCPPGDLAGLLSVALARGWQREKGYGFPSRSPVEVNR